MQNIKVFPKKTLYTRKEIRVKKLVVFSLHKGLKKKVQFIIGSQL